MMERWGLQGMRSFEQESVARKEGVKADQPIALVEDAQRTQQ